MKKNWRQFIENKRKTIENHCQRKIEGNGQGPPNRRKRKDLRQLICESHTIDKKRRKLEATHSRKTENKLKALDNKDEI